MELDFQYIDDLSGDDKEYKNQLLNILLSELNNERLLFIEAAEKVNHKDMYAAVHKSKHKIKMFNLENFYTFIVGFEDNLKNEKMTSEEKKQYIEGIEELISQLTKIVL